MGQTSSKGGSHGKESSSTTPSNTGVQTSSNSRHHVASSERKTPRRRESANFSVALPANTGPLTAKPSASLESATAQLPASSNSSTRSARDSLRSQSIGQAPVHLTPTTSLTGSVEDMGNQESKPQQTHKRHQSSPSPQQPKPIPIDVTPEKAAAAASEREPLSPVPTEPSVPLDGSFLPGSQYSRPPRLPLPIETELHTPGSPIISPADLAPVGTLDGLPRRSSILSSTTVDDDDLGDDLETLEGGPHPPVPTMIEWIEGGEKVYVTGTFAGWDRKFRLQKNGPSKQPGALSAEINLQPGTHHVRFIVDGDMKLSKFMPTTVDFTNFLVNWIEVGPDPEATPANTQSIDVPSGKQQLPTEAGPSQPRPIEYRAPPGIHPPHVLPPTPELIPIHTRDTTPRASPKSVTTQPTPVAPQPPKQYHSKVPQFLLDLDAPEDSPRYNRANAVLNTAPAAPSLPMFLNKSILNGTTPMKDDASVLNMPNHTMLNHLATSSIKNKVLATSATTRYRRKFLTTIMYKPTSSAGE